MASHPSGYATRELSPKTWPDFARLRSQGGGWAFCWCMHFHRPRSLPKHKRFRTRPERSVRNRREKRELVARGRAHGILVYAHGEPVGWCQYGPREELPRVDNSRKYRNLAPEDSRERLWRITCFVVDKKYRKSGVASAALNTALESIRNKGGGLVEAIPVSKTDQGPGYMCTGTVSMFEKAGFKIVAPFGNGRTTTVVMRRTI